MVMTNLDQRLQNSVEERPITLLFGQGQQENRMRVHGSQQTIPQGHGAGKEIGARDRSPERLHGAHEGHDVARVLRMRAEIDMVSRGEEVLETLPRQHQLIVLDV